MQKLILPHGGPKRIMGMFNSPGMVDKGHAGTFTRSSVATGIDHNGKYRPVKANEPTLWGSSPAPYFIRQSSLTVTPTLNTQYYYHWLIDEANAILYASAGSDGVKAFDISVPTAPVLLDSERNKNAAGNVVGDPIRGLILVGSTLFCVSRTGSNGTGTGRLIAYDVTNISTTGFSWTSTVDVTGDLYSDIAHLNTGGTDYACIAGQLSGFWIYNISNPASMTLTGQLETGFETQGLDVSGDFAYVCNYDEAQTFRVIDCSNPALPSIVGSCGATTTIAGVALRPWDCVVDGNYAYVCSNTSTGVGDSVLRGLLVVDVTTPASVTDWLAHEPIDALDVDTWITSDLNGTETGVGDRPQLGISKQGHFVYIANGQRGTAIFDVKDPTAPEYIGLQGTNIPSGTNLYDVQIFTLNGVDYAVYGDGPETYGASGSAQADAEQMHTLYIDKIAYGARRSSASKGILLEGAATNVLTDPDVPASQVTGSLATGNWTLSCQGSGSITSVAITAVGTGFGAATEGTPNTFNLTGAGTVGLTVAGSLDWIQLEAGAFNTSFVDGARAIHTFTLPGHTFKPNDMSIYFEFYPHALTGLTEEVFFDLVSGAFAYKIFYVPSTRKVWHRKVTGAGTFSHGFVLSVGEIAVGTKIRIACKLEKGVGMKGWANGQAFAGPVTDDSDITTTGTIYVGKRAAGTFPCYGAIGNVQIWHKPLSDTFLAGYGA